MKSAQCPGEGSGQTFINQSRENTIKLDVIIPLQLGVVYYIMNRNYELIRS